MNTQRHEIGPAGPYVVVRVGERSNGGILRLPEQMTGVPPYWAAYFTVEDCNNAVARVEDLGGRVLIPPLDAPNGRFAGVADPQGGAFGLFVGETDD
jgi:predicted enzyme related to lactoylglutathione lyase